MCTRVVVDACSIGIFQTARVKGDCPKAVLAMDFVLEHCRIVTDDGSLIEGEWSAAASCHTHAELALSDWIADQRASGRLVSEPYKPDREIKKALRKLGVPGRDPIYLCGAQQWGAFAIITDDGDFYDPKAEGKYRARLMKQRKGPVARYAKSLGVRVTTLADTPDVVPECDGRV